MSSSQSTGVSLRHKLSLKRSNSDSTQNTLSSKIISSPENDASKANSCNKSISQNESACQEPDVEDSLADFKSPKEDKVTKPIFNKFKFEKEKVKRKLIKSKSKPAKSVVGVKQPSIESSFFKPPKASILSEGQQEASLCPLCLIPFKDDLTCTNHMKTCAAKNNVSLQQLLDAKRLQERQAEERKALGLLAAPVIPEKKKTFRSKNYSTGDDAQLQLVLAMSESLYEAELQQELEQAAVLAGIPAECVKDINAEERRKTLQSFGFSTNKPVAEIPVKQTKRKKLQGPTILQSRSKEDKDRVLTERIACIITGDDALTQAQRRLDASLIVNREKTPTALRSQVLRSIEQSSYKLWDLSRLTRKFHDFYVEELKSQLLKDDRKLEEADDSAGPSNALENSSEARTEEKNASESLANTSIEYEPVDIQLLVDQNKETHSLEITENWTDDNDDDDNDDKMNSELDFIKVNTSNWARALNNSAKSDLLIFVKNSKKIYAHTLVLYMQCPNILNSRIENDSLRDTRIKDKVNWLTKDQLSSLAFLEYVYCGHISKYVEIFYRKDLLDEVLELGNQYKMKHLSDYIELKKNEFRSDKRASVVVSPVSPMKFKSPPPKKKIPFDKYKETRGLPAMCNNNDSTKFRNIQRRDKGTQINQDFLSSITKNQEIQTIETSEKSSINEESVTSTPFKCPDKPVNHTERRYTSSPVLFESMDESIFTMSTPRRRAESTQNSGNLNILVDLINQDNNEDKENTSTSVEKQHIEECVDDYQLTNSQETIINLSPRRVERRGSVSLSGENIHNISTQINRQIPNKNSISMTETIDPESNSFSRAPTPELNMSRTNQITPKTRESPEREVIDLESDEELVEDNQESIHDVVTPPRCDSTVENYKTKNELDSFLRKVQRANAKDALDTESESEISFAQQRRRNIFLKKDRDDSYGYLKNKGTHEQNRKVISMLERDISKNDKSSSNRSLDQSAKKSQAVNHSVNEHFRETDDPQVIDDSHFEALANDAATSNTKKDNGNVSDHSMSTDESENITTDENEMSMYSRFKKQNQHDNSLRKYYDKLNFASKKNSVKLNSDNSKGQESDNCFSASSSRRFLMANNEADRKVIEDVTLVYDSDDEQQDVSQLLTPKKSQSNISQTSNVHLSRTESALDLVEEQISKIMNGSEESNDNFIDLSSDSDHENDKSYCNKNSSIEKNNQQSFRKSNEKNDDYNLEKNSSNENVSKDKEKLSTINEDNSKKQREIINLSPISVISSDDEYINYDIVSPLRNQFSEFDSPASPPPHEKTRASNYFDLESPESPPPCDKAPMNNFSHLDTPKSPPEHVRAPRNKLSKLELPPQNVRTLPTPSPPSPILSQNRKRSKAVRKLQTKSASTSNFETPPKKKKTQKSYEFEDALKDLSSCETPQLHKKLKQFGLKPQNRKNSTALLKLIYTKLCEQESEASGSKKRILSKEFSSDDDDDEPPLKKQSIPEKSKKISAKEKGRPKTTSRLEDQAVIAEELDHNELETAENLEDYSSIKLAFCNLMNTDKELRNKVLTYKPLPLELLHLTLKTNGLNCKKDKLMNFLDEQCITFQMQMGKNDRKKNKK